MTQKERTQCKLLVQEEKDEEQQEGQGEWIYRVRGPPTDLRIIKLKKKTLNIAPQINRAQSEAG